MQHIGALLICLFIPLAMVANDKSQSNILGIVGTYKGSVFNGDNMDPVLTNFFLNESGQIAGKYAIGEENSLEFGELSNCQKESDYTLVCDWKDKYGTGVLRILVSSNYHFFYGLWSKNQYETNLPWNGVKKE